MSATIPDATNVATVVYLNGVSSAGKSTLARALVGLMKEPYCLVSMDQFEGMAARRFPLPGADQFYDDCLVPLIHHAAASFARARLGVVLDVVVTKGEWLRDAARSLDGHRVFLIGVRCDVDELRRRERERGNRRIGVAERQLAYVHKAVEELCGYDFEVDTTHMAAEECAQLIGRHLADGEAPRAFARVRQDGIVD